MKELLNLKHALATAADVFMAEKKKFCSSDPKKYFNLGVTQDFCSCTILVSASGKNSLMPLHHIDIHYV